MRIIAIVTLAAILAAPLPSQDGGPRDEEMIVSMRSVKLYLGREKAFVVQTFEQRPGGKVAVTPDVDIAVDDSSVASIERYGNIGIRVVAQNFGSTTIVIRSRRNPDNIVRIPVKVIYAPLLSWFGMTVSASSRLVSAVDSDVKLGPSWPQVRVRITNLMPTWRTTRVSPCVVSVRIYRRADHRDRPVGGRRGTCYQDELLMRWAPFQTRVFRTEWSDVAVAFDSLSPRRYYVTALVDRKRDLLEVDAGTIDVRDWNAGLQVLASVIAVGDSLRLRTVIHNHNAQTAGLHYVPFGCESHVVAFRDSSERGHAVWQRGSGKRQLMFPNGCPQIRSVKVVAHDSISPAALNLMLPTEAVLGDSLQAGTYFFTAIVDVNGAPMRARTGPVYLSRPAQ